MLAAKPGIQDLALTTNGVLLAEHAETLRAVRAPSRHREPRHAAARALPRADASRRATRRCWRASRRRRARASRARSRSTRVIIRGVNDDELVDLIEYGRSVGAEVRFIEYMDVGGATAGRWRRSSRAPRCSRASASAYGRVEPIVEQTSAPAERFRLADGTVFGIIASTTAPFCRDVRPEPAHRRRHVVPLPLRDRAAPICGDRCARARPREDLAALIASTWARPRRSRRRGAPRRAGPRAAGADRRAAAGSAPRDAHAWRVAAGDRAERPRRPEPRARPGRQRQPRRQR